MSETFHPSGLPSYFRYLIFGIIITLILEFLVPHLPDNIKGYNDKSILIVWLLVVTRAGMSFIANRFRVIELSDHDIILKTGIISVKRTIIPFERIANVNTHQSLLQRIFKIANVKIDSTSGSHDADIEIENLHNNAVEQILQKNKRKIL